MRLHPVITDTSRLHSSSFLESRGERGIPTLTLLFGMGVHTDAVESRSATSRLKYLAGIGIPPSGRDFRTFWSRTLAFALFTLLSLSTLCGQNPGMTPGRSQAHPNSGSKAQQPDMTWLQDMAKDPELLAELAQLTDRLQKGIVYPAPRRESRILQRLPESTVFYIALPNYGETLHQAVNIFDRSLQDSPHLRAFLKKNNFDSLQPTIETAVQRFYEVSQFLGDEVVITGRLQGKEPTGVMIAEVKRPGIKEALEKINKDLITSPGDRLRILEPQQLATTGETRSPAVLIGPDYVAFGLSLSALRDFTAQFEQRGFVTKALGKRLMDSYQGGTNTVIGIDLHQLVGLIPANKPQDRLMLEKTGLADVSYLVSENTLSAESSRNQGEVTFNGPRRGIASWIALPERMGGLDFVSANAAIAVDMILKSPARILDDVEEIMPGSTSVFLPQMEAQMKINLKRDILSKLTGEIAIETQANPMLNPMAAPQKSAMLAGPAPTPSFKLILGLSDSAGLQQIVGKLLTKSPFQQGETEEDGVTVHTLTITGAGGNSTEIDYFFLDNYLVIASDRSLAEEAVRAHRKGTSLERSGKLQEPLHRGQTPTASMIVYQDAGQMLGPMIAQLPPELRQLVAEGTKVNTKPNIFYVYADESSLRGISSNSMQTDASIGLIVAAIAIPNLIRSRETANDAAAVSSLRVVNTAEVTYATSYPDRGYAAGLSALGPGASGDCTGSNATADRACLLDGVLANASCTSGKWCVKTGYRFSLRGVCMMGKCVSYAVTATPVNPSTGSKSFCSTEDAVIRSNTGAPLGGPLTAAECKKWAPMR